MKRHSRQIPLTPLHKNHKFNRSEIFSSSIVTKEIKSEKFEHLSNESSVLFLIVYPIPSCCVTSGNQLEAGISDEGKVILL